MKSKLLVIIVTYNGLKWIEKCISSVFNSTISADLFVVDNGSTDGTLEYLENIGNIILIKSKENLGFGKANNLGLKYALENDFDYVYLLNQDAWVFSDTFETLIKILQEKHTIGIISPLQINAKENALDRNFSECCPPAIVSDLFFNNIKNVYKCNFIMAAHWMLTKECLKKIGGFSPAFPHYGEDNNYIQRCNFKNLDVTICTKTMAVHDREFRDNNTKNFSFYYTYIKGLMILNNPFIKHKFLIFNKFYITTIIKEFNVKNIKNYFKLLINYLRIKKIYQLSFQEKAFI